MLCAMYVLNRVYSTIHNVNWHIQDYAVVVKSIEKFITSICFVCHLIVAYCAKGGCLSVSVLN